MSGCLFYFSFDRLVTVKEVRFYMKNDAHVGILIVNTVPILIIIAWRLRDSTKIVKTFRRSIRVDIILRTL